MTALSPFFDKPGKPLSCYDRRPVLQIAAKQPAHDPKNASHIMDNTSLQIQLRGVRVHNLKNVDLDLPHNQVTTFCGVSGSGKTSLALDTLYAEGQRRYIESFSARTRQYVQVKEKADADSITGIPPAIAVTKNYARASNRSTVGTATEIQEFLSLLFAKIGTLFCFDCDKPVRRDSPDSVARLIASIPDGIRLMIGFPEPIVLPVTNQTQTELEQFDSLEAATARLRQSGFVRVIAGGQTFNLSDRESVVQLAAVFEENQLKPELNIVVDRIVSDSSQDNRLLDSLGTAFDEGHGRCFLLIERSANLIAADIDGMPVEVDGRDFLRLDFNREFLCAACGIAYPDPQPKLFSFTSALGACPNCEGYGRVPEFDMDLIVPDRTKTIREGAIAPWTTSAYKHELEELLALADEYSIPVDVPFSRLNEEQISLIWDGVPERDFGGLTGFFHWLEKRRYKMHLRVFFNRWRSNRTCEICEGDRYNELALAFRIKSENANETQSIADLTQSPVNQLSTWLAELNLNTHQQSLANHIVRQIQTRLSYLQDVGLGYLTLDRSLAELSGGEAQRVALTSAIGSRLVNMLYVLDEPTSGLHPAELEGLIKSIRGLAERGNTVVCVEHNPQLFEASDAIVEIGPEAGSLGGEILFHGALSSLMRQKKSPTAQFLNGKRGLYFPDKRRETKQGMIRLHEANGRNLKNLTVEFPIGVLTVVTGVSGAGKTSLVIDTLFPAICRRLQIDSVAPLDCRDVVGLGPLEDAILVDQTPVGRSPKSNPATFTKAFDPIRAIFAETVDAKTHNYKIGHFSFNSELGRCPTCKGDGYLTTDMKFLADVLVKCGDCQGTRYRREMLSVRYRGLNIAEVLDMSVRDAFGFFRGQNKVQSSLRQLLEVGLDYLKLGQPATTLSVGEAQRLKLAAHLATVKRKRTLFVLDEPTGGLHFADIVKLEDCFQSLLNVGHSLIVVTHNLQLIRAADFVIDLGPGAAHAGGQLVATGTPEEIASCERSVTGRYLKSALDGKWNGNA